jgi:fused signal recognition particle receptor
VSKVQGDRQAKSSGFFKRLSKGLKRTRERFTGGLARVVQRPHMTAQDLIEEIETLMLSADMGIEATGRILSHMKSYLGRKELSDPELLYRTLGEEMLSVLKPVSQPLIIPRHRITPFVILIVGVNGSGKTTTIGKLAHRLRTEGRSVALAAADTFRAAAVEQLEIWGARNQVPVTVAPAGADPAAVVFTALEAAKAQGIEVLIVDTAGRLHTQTPLMEQLKKIVRVMARLDPTAPHETLLVLDASTGQNALSQARQFHTAVKITGLVLAKMDGTAKGGILLALAEHLQIPVRFIGIGEQLDDLQVFDPRVFVDALLDRDLG